MADNPNGNGHPRRPLVEAAAQSVFMTGLARIAIVVVTGIGFPLSLAGMIYFLDWASGQNEINQRQTNALSLLEYRIGQAEALNRDQEKHFQASDARINRLERFIPDPSFR